MNRSGNSKHNKKVKKKEIKLETHQPKLGFGFGQSAMINDG